MMKEILQKLRSNPLSDNKLDGVERVLLENPELQETWLPKLRHLTEMTTHDRREVNKWDWMYDKITNAILVYYCYLPWLGRFEVIQEDEVIGEFILRLPLSVDPWAFESFIEYDLVGTMNGKIKIQTVKGIDLLRGMWTVGNVTYRKIEGNQV